MRNKLSVLLMLWFAFLGLSANAQGWDEKITWSFKIQKIDSENAYIVATATMIPGWHVFSMSHDPSKADFTGMPTSFKFLPNENYKLVGKVKESKKAHVHEDILGTSLYHEGSVSFKQKIKVLTEKSFDLKLEYSFQVCDENGCLFPPDQETTLAVKGFKPVVEEAPEASAEEEMQINGDFAKDKDGNDFVKFEGKWVAVPKENSPKFYKKYLELGGDVK